jgi:dTDP-glucose pyrophosphorylase
MTCQVLESWWSDAGTFESLLKASSLVSNKKLCECTDNKTPIELPKVGVSGEFGNLEKSDR